MEQTKNLCAQIPLSLHTRVREEQERANQTVSQYITQLLTSYYEHCDNKGNGGLTMENGRTMAFQIPEELFQRIKNHLTRETKRTGQKLSQRTFVLGLIEQALSKAEALDATALPPAGDEIQPTQEEPDTERALDGRETAQPHD